MIKLEIEIKRANLTSRMHAKIMKILNREAMERQWNERVPQHFEYKAYSKYRARPRSVQYVKTKRNLKEHNKPNVFTGELQKSLKHKITATQNGARLTIRGSIGTKIDPAIWAAMSKKEKSAITKKQRRLANWQKREIAVMTKDEIRQERKRMAIDYRIRALSPEFSRKRTRRIK